MSFKWHAILSKMKTSHAISLCLTQDVTHPFSQLNTCFVPILVIRSHSVAFKEPLLYTTMAPKCKNSDAVNADRPKRSCKFLERKKVLLPSSMVRTNLLSMKL